MCSNPGEIVPDFRPKTDKKSDYSDALLGGEDLKRALANLERLGAESVTDREAAARALIGKGAAMLPLLLEKKAHCADPDLNGRIDEILKDIRLQEERRDCPPWWR